MVNEALKKEIGKAMARLVRQALDDQAQRLFGVDFAKNSDYAATYSRFYTGYTGTEGREPFLHSNCSCTTEKTCAIPQRCCGGIAQEVFVEGKVVMYICGVCGKQWSPGMRVKKYGQGYGMVRVVPRAIK